MAILAVGAVIHAGPGYVVVSGTSWDRGVHFDPNAGTIDVNGGTINVNGLDFSSPTLKADIEAGLKAKLSAAPYNMTFASDDTVLIVP